MPVPDGEQWTAYEQELMNAAERRLKDPTPLGRGTPKGVLGPLDQDQIDRTTAAKNQLEDFGYTMSDTGMRGFTVDVGDPDVHVVGGAHPETTGFSVSVRHGDRFATNEDGSYKYPEDWGMHNAHLDVSEHELPGAIMDWLSDTETQRHMRRPDI
jgi:hypothetical protein